MPSVAIERGGIAHRKPQTRGRARSVQIPAGDATDALRLTVWNIGLAGRLRHLSFRCHSPGSGRFGVQPPGSQVYTQAMNTHLLDQARQLCVQDQLALVEALWDDIAKRNAVPPPTAAKQEELERRLADHEANPDDVVPWSEVKASALARIGR